MTARRLTAGVYNIGQSMANETISGTRTKPIIFRAAVDGWGAPVRATINGSIYSRVKSDHIWWWGVEVTDLSAPGSCVSPGPCYNTGSGVATTENTGGGNDVKFINLFIHDKYLHVLRVHNLDPHYDWQNIMTCMLQNAMRLKIVGT